MRTTISLILLWGFPLFAAGTVDDVKNRLPLKDAYEKLTDNHGNGFEPLYGTRNFRVVLQGIAYRGGANNMFHRDHPRDNMNPLPKDGLENLCKEGFSEAVYLYEDNFKSAPPQTRCQDQKAVRVLNYEQLTPTDVNDVRTMLAKVFDVINGKADGPIYFHCWNGWHFSGLISALTLRQFCGLAGDEAVNYWNVNTDGNDDEPQYEKIRQRIRDFKPFADLQITTAQAAEICPKL
jgi:hypothetical protein